MEQTVRYILLEEEPITSLGLRRMISSLRPNYRLVAVGECAFPIKDLLNDNSVDLIISEACLADCYSFEVLKEIGCTKPIIVYTVYEKFHDSFKGLNIVYFALKPISAEQLEESLCAFENKFRIYKP